MTRRLVLVAGSCGLLALVGVYAATQELTRTEAASMEKKIAAILERGNRTPAPSAQPLRTPISEREVNAFLRFSPQAQMPVGLVSPRITISEGGALEGRAFVDLDAIRKSKPRGVLDPLNFMGGSVEAALTGRLFATNGKGVFQFRTATLGGVAIPKSLLQEIVSYYTRTTDHPNGVDLDSPFDLPHHIRQVDVQRGAATIVQ